MKKLSKADVAAALNSLKTADHHVIYKLQMRQAQDTRKMFPDDPETLARIAQIEADIRETYRRACEEAV